MVIAVAERAHVDAHPELLVRLREHWSPTAYAWSTAFREGATRTRWLDMGGDEVDRVVNLLWPAAVAGEWDAAAAVGHAERLRAVARARRHSLVLLGRRVERAFGLPPHGWGQPREVDGVRYVTLPHPSGRGRVLNDRDVRAALRQALADFCAYERGSRTAPGGLGPGGVRLAGRGPRTGLSC